MNKLSFKPNSPGMQILWILQFDPKNAQQPDLYIPSPFENEWHNASQLQKTLDNLDNIQKICAAIKEETKTVSPKETFFLKYINKLKNLLGNITNDTSSDQKDEETK